MTEDTPTDEELLPTEEPGADEEDARDDDPTGLLEANDALEDRLEPPDPTSDDDDTPLLTPMVDVAEDVEVLLPGAAELPAEVLEAGSMRLEDVMLPPEDELPAGRG